MEFHEWMFDKRVVRRNLRRKLMTQKDLKQYLDSLPDRSDDTVSIWLDADYVDDEDEDEDEDEEEDEEEDAAAIAARRRRIEGDDE